MKETVKRALDLLRRKEWEACDYASNVSEAADILEKGLQALAAPVQEPVAWMVIGDGEYGEYTPGTHFDTVKYKEYWERRGYELQPLYATPPPQPAQPAPVQVSPTDFVDMVMDKEDAIGKPIFWAEWPNREKNNAA
jgi:hypothetical protein